MRRGATGLLVLAALFAAMVLLSLRVVHALRAPPDLLEQKLVAAERYLYYRVTAADGPRFELTGAEHTLRLVSHALLPAGTAGYDPARELVYGLRLEIVADGQVTWAHDVYARSRQSKARHVDAHGGLWLDENAFSLVPGVEVTDDRQTIVQLPADLPAGAELRVRLLGESKEALLRVYAEVERSKRRRELLLRQLSPAEREAIADRVSYVPWDRLAYAERIARLRLVELRLPAAGKEDVDYRTSVLYDSGFRLVAPVDAGERGLLVTPEHAAALNVVGPAQLTLTLHRPAAAEGDHSAQTLVVHALGEDRVAEPYAIDVPAGGTQVLHPVPVGAGVHTIALSTLAPLGVLVEVSGAALAGGVPGAPVVPDSVALPAYWCDAEGAPVLIAVDGPDDDLGRALRLDVRLVATGSAPGVELAGDVTLSALDAAGAVLAQSRTKVVSLRAPFEQAQGHGGTLDAVTEVVSLRYVAPRGTARVSVRTSRPAVLRLAAPVSLAPAPNSLDEPFAAVPLATLVWRYARYAQTAWQPLRAANHAALSPERTVKLTAQARLELRPPPEPPATTVAEALAPDGGPERQTVLERVQPEDAARVRADWGRGNYLRLVPGQAQRVDFTPGPTRAKVQYWILARKDDVLGETVELVLDGETIERKRFVTTHGTWDLPRGLEGAHTLLVRTRATTVRLLVDRPPAGAGGELYALRTIYALDRPLRVRAVKGAAPLALDIVVYGRDAAADEDVSFRVLVDGGAPRRVTGVALERWTLAERRLTLPAADREPTIGFANVAEKGKLYPRLLVIGLGDDLPAGAHTIEIQTRGGGHGWARFFVLSGHRARTDQAIQWRTSGEGSDE